MRETYYINTKNQDVISLSELYDSWDEMETEEQAEYEGQFESYVEALQDYNGGILEEMDEEMVSIYLAKEASDYYEDLFGEARQAQKEGWF